MRVSATAKYLRGSTRKARLVTQAIKGKPVEEAAALLRFMPQAAAKRRRARAEERDGERREQPEPVGRRARRRRCASPTRVRRSSAGARGPRVGPSRSTSRMTHITVVVGDREA